jgi:RES domain-containing protein
MARLDVAWVPVEGIWVRQTRPVAGGTEAQAFDARWQAPDTPAAYFADSDDTVWAEFYRALAERRVKPDDALPRDLHRVHVSLERVADLSKESARRALGLPRLRQTSEQWPVFQPVGERLAAQGAEAIL